MASISQNSTGPRAGNLTTAEYSSSTLLSSASSVHRQNIPLQHALGRVRDATRSPRPADPLGPPQLTVDPSFLFVDHSLASPAAQSPYSDASFDLLIKQFEADQQSISRPNDDQLTNDIDSYSALDLENSQNNNAVELTGLNGGTSSSFNHMTGHRFSLPTLSFQTPDLFQPIHPQWHVPKSPQTHSIVTPSIGTWQGQGESQKTPHQSILEIADDDQHIHTGRNTETGRFPKTDNSSSPSDPANESINDRRGVDPHDRKYIGNLEMPSLNEQQAQREKNEKDDIINDWLDRSGRCDPEPPDNTVEVPNSPAHNPNQLSVPSHLGLGRPRSKSASHTSDTISNPTIRFDDQPRPNVTVVDDSGEDSDSNGGHDGDEEHAEDEGTAISSRPSTEIGPPMDSSNRAMELYSARVKMIEPASRTATMGTIYQGRRSLDSLLSNEPDSSYASPGLDSQRTLVRDKNHPRIMELLKKGVSARKPKDAQALEKRALGDYLHQPVAQGHGRSKLSSTLSRNPSHKGQRAGTPPRATEDSVHSIPQQLMSRLHNVIKRNRSRGHAERESSDSGKLLRDQAGPSTLNASPPSAELADIDKEDIIREPMVKPENDVLSRVDQVNLHPLRRPVQFYGPPLRPLSGPTRQAFEDHIRAVYPELEPSLLSRILQHQQERYKRLREYRRQAGTTADAARSSPDIRRTEGSNGAENIKSRESKVYRVVSGNGKDDSDVAQGGSCLLAEFPNGMPLPPVTMIPAVFQCNWCFKVLEHIEKPSDWTKHVLEDLQPYVCTFPSCTPPRAFKRKADWVRHDNELHLQRERWKCDMPGCAHQSFRKDNFTSHLSREHSPKDLAKRVEKCRQVSEKRPQDEPCRFCNKRHNDWKSLWKCLANHMEQIALPILGLIESLEDGEDDMSGLEIEQLNGPPHGMEQTPENQGETVDTTPRKDGPDNGTNPGLLTASNLESQKNRLNIRGLHRSSATSRKPSPAPSAQSTAATVRQDYSGLGISSHATSSPSYLPDNHQFVPDQIGTQGRFDGWPQEQEQRPPLFPHQSAPSAVPIVDDEGFFLESASSSPPTAVERWALMQQHASPPFYPSQATLQASPPAATPQTFHSGYPTPSGYMSHQHTPSPMLDPSRAWAPPLNSTAVHQPSTSSYTFEHLNDETFGQYQPMVMPNDALSMSFNQRMSIDDGTEDPNGFTAVADYQNDGSMYYLRPDVQAAIQQQHMYQQQQHFAQQLVQQQQQQQQQREAYTFTSQQQSPEKSAHGGLRRQVQPLTAQGPRRSSGRALGNPFGQVRGGNKREFNEST